MLKTITRQLFIRLNRHLPYRLVHRDPLPGAQTAANAAIPPSLSERCLNVATMEQETLWRVFDSHPEGLNAAGVMRAREQYGENRLPAQKPSPWWVHLWVCYRNPFNILLTILGGISYATEGSVCCRRYRPDGLYFNAIELCAGSAFDKSGGCAKSNGQ